MSALLTAVTNYCNVLYSPVPSVLMLATIMALILPGSALNKGLCKLLGAAVVLIMPLRTCSNKCKQGQTRAYGSLVVCLSVCLFVCYRYICSPAAGEIQVL